MHCKYCQNELYEPFPDALESLNFNIIDDDSNDDTELSVTIVNRNTLDASLVSNNEYQDIQKSVQAKINFCPMCGRKL